MQSIFIQPVQVEEPLDKAVDAIPEATLNQLLDSFAVASSYTEFSGNIARISLEDRIAAMQAQGAKLESAEQAEQLLLQRKREPFLNGLPLVQVQSGGGSNAQNLRQAGRSGKIVLAITSGRR